jgi:TolB-like protein/class 3 adenylate cyclase/Tfp pilus assembly protein PilF
MAEEGFERKLAAILSADVEGYSRLMDDDEEATVRTLTSYRSAISDLVQQYRGRVVDSPGDNILAEFKSVVDAVNCAVEIQRELAERNAELPYHRMMQFRIGVNLGDVIDEDGRIYGDGVNIAARVESLAEAGGICISGRAHTQIENKLGLEYEDLGKHEVKNISRPIQVYRVLSFPGAAAHRVVQAKETLGRRWRNITIFAAVAVVIIGGLAFWQYYMRRPTLEPASIEKMALQLPDKPSIAVLPFNNFSKDPGQEYIADGISENIITTLSKTAKLFVIARNSAFAYKGKPVSVKQVSEDLGVRYILEGSVQISNNRIRITAQLIDAIKGAHIWAQKYDKNIDDIFQLQDEIALKILEALRVELTEGEQAILIGADTKNIDAYLSFLKGLEQTWRFNKEAIALARKAAQAAIEIDPMYPSGYRLLAWTHMMDIWLGASKDPKMSVKKAFKLLEKVRSLDENSPGYYFLMGQLLLLTRQHDKAIKSGERAVSLSPNNSTFLNGLALIHRYNGEPEKALSLQKKALRLNPYPESLYYTNLGHIYVAIEKYEEAIQAYRKAAQISPNQYLNHLGLASAYSQLGHTEKARAAMSEALALRPQLSFESVKTFYRHKTDLDRFVARMEMAGLPKHPPLPLPDKPSIAVLAFDNLSGDPEQEYFSDGIAENIITALSQVGELFVIARNSSFTYKGKPVKVQQVGRELGVRYVLEGSVQKSGDRVRITAQLINARNGQHLWAQKYDRDFKDIFEIQDEITMKIITALRVKLTEGEQFRVYAKQFKSLDVYLKQAQANSLWNEGTMASHRRYGQLSQEIIDLEPGSPIGYRLLAWYHYRLASFGDSPQENLKKAFMLCQKALAMDKSTGYPYALMGWIYLQMKKWEKAIESGKRSVELDPNNAFFLVLYGSTLNDAGRIDEAIAFIKQAIRLNPFPAYYYYFHLGRSYAQKGQYEDALKEFKKALQRAPEAAHIHGALAITYIRLGREEEARASTAKMLEIAPWVTISLVSKSLTPKDQEFNKLTVEAMRKAGFPE